MNLANLRGDLSSHLVGLVGTLEIWLYEHFVEVWLRPNCFLMEDIQMFLVSLLGTALGPSPCHTGLKMPDSSRLRVEGFYFGSHCRGSVHHSREGTRARDMAAGAIASAARKQRQMCEVSPLSPISHDLGPQSMEWCFPTHNINLPQLA